MKKLLIPTFAVLLASCSPSVYYQVFKTTPENGVLVNNNIVFEDKNCTIFYDLWADKGDIGFTFYNKSENDLTLDLTKTFFVLNGFANEYFQNRIFSTAKSSGTSSIKYAYPNYYNNIKVEGSASTTYTTSYTEKHQRLIPSRTSVEITEFNISSTPYSDCKYSSEPRRNNLNKLTFDKTNSPMNFYNIITYTMNSEIFKIENKFYVSELANLPLSKMLVNQDTNSCGKKLNYPSAGLIRGAANSFYIKYIPIK